jgi:3-oxoadipate enol-lactonase
MEPRAETSVGDLTLSYLARGTGEPVLLVHAGVLADWFQPLLAEPALTGRYRLISYHRANYGQSSHVPGPLSVRDHARHARLLLLKLGIERAHVVGHSVGAAIALQLALDSPDVVHSLTVMDAAVSEQGNTSAPAREGQPGRPRQPPFMQEISDLVAAGRADLAVDAFMRNVCGSEYRVVVDRMLPGAFEQAVADADGLFQQEIPALLTWQFRPEQARRIACPTLVVAGGESPPIFAQRQQRLVEWLPNAEAFTLPGAGHLLMLEQPRALAEALAAFLARHPL